MVNHPILVPFKAEHLLMLVHRDAGYLESARDAVDKERRGPAFTAIYDNRIIACSGVILLWPGVGAAWAVFTSDVVKHRIWVTRTIRRTLNDIIRVYKLHRVELVALEDNDVNIAWAQSLGFARENGCATAYTVNKKNVIRMELVNG